jgi:hypothetical protein
LWIGEDYRYYRSRRSYDLGYRHPVHSHPVWDQPGPHPVRISGPLDRPLQFVYTNRLHSQMGRYGVTESPVAGTSQLR